MGCKKKTVSVKFVHMIYNYSRRSPRARDPNSRPGSGGVEEETALLQTLRAPKVTRCRILIMQQIRSINRYFRGAAHIDLL